MTGNFGSDPTNPLFVLDESLAPVVAQALTLVGYNFVPLETAIGRQGAKDPQVIAWCKENNAVWVHADDRARKQHKAQLQTSGIRTLWVYRTKGQMTGKEQLRILASVLPQLIQNLANNPGIRHHKATVANENSKPSLTILTI